MQTGVGGTKVSVQQPPMTTSEGKERLESVAPSGPALSTSNVWRTQGADSRGGSIRAASGAGAHGPGFGRDPKAGKGQEAPGAPRAGWGLQSLGRGTWGGVRVRSGLFRWALGWKGKQPFRELAVMGLSRGAQVGF